MRITPTRFEPPAAGLELAHSVSELGSGLRVDVTVRNRGPAAAAVPPVRIELDWHPQRVLEHGWQSWSPVRVATPEDVRPRRAGAPWWLRAQLHADAASAGTAVCGDQFLLGSDGLAGCLDGRESIVSFMASPASGVAAVFHLDEAEVPPAGELSLDPIWLAEGDPGRLYSEYARLWGFEARARAAARLPDLSWCSWYEYWSHVTPDDVRANTALAAAHGIELVQIDDGYQREIGDWLVGSPAWNGPVTDLAGEISAAGCRPGIWLAPFVATPSSELARLHPDWFVVESASAEPVPALYNPIWKGWAHALDTSNPAVLDHLRDVFSALRDGGFTYFKIDFCFAAAMPGRRRRPGTGRMAALRSGLLAIREAIGDDALLVGCGCPLPAAVGIVDAMRVSEDVAPYWEPRGSFEDYEENAPAARNAVSATALRAPLHRRLWANDPDCALVRSTGTLLSREESRVLVHTVVGASGFVVLSDDLARYGPEEWGRVGRMAALGAQADAELDIDDPFATPLVVRGPELRLDVSWEDVSSRLVSLADGTSFLP